MCYDPCFFSAYVVCCALLGLANNNSAAVTAADIGTEK